MVRLLSIPKNACLLLLSVDRAASLVCSCPIDGPDKYILSIRMPTGKWGWNAHGGDVYRELANHHVILPSLPKDYSDRMVFSANDLIIEKDPYRANQKYWDSPTAGTVTVDVSARQAIVNLMTPLGPYEGNGVHRLSAIALTSHVRCYGTKVKTPNGLEETEKCKKPVETK